MRQESLDVGDSDKAVALWKIIVQLQSRRDPIYTMDDFKDIKGVGPIVRSKIGSVIDGLEETSGSGIKSLKISSVEMAIHKKILLGLQLMPQMEPCIVDSCRRGGDKIEDFCLIIKYNNDISLCEAQFSFSGIVRHLWSIGYITTELITEQTNWKGHVKIPSDEMHVYPTRQVCMRLVPDHEYPYVLLHLTATTAFTESLVEFCQNLGYKIDETAMTPITDGIIQPPKMITERDIFDFIGLEYVNPANREEAIAVKRRI